MEPSKVHSRLRCPAVGCGWRVALLYCGATFACRVCCDLAYPGQGARQDQQGLRCADTIRSQLQRPPDVLNGIGDKPKHMNWRTFERLAKEHDSLVATSLAGLTGHLGMREK